MKWWRSKWFIVIVAVAICGAGSWLYLAKGKKSAAAEQTEVVVEAKKGNIRSSVSGTSQFEPKETQIISAPADGTIKSIHLVKNQPVKAGDVLIELSSSTLENDLQDAQMAYEQLQRDMTDLLAQEGSLQATAPISGKITYGGNLDVGSTVNKSTKLATIANVSKLTVTLPFFLEDAVQLHKGDPVDLTMDGFMLTKTGTIQSIGNDPKSDGKGGKLLDVEVAIDNDGSMDAGMNALGTVTIGERSVDSEGKAQLAYSQTASVLANTSGSIVKLPYKSGDIVKAGAVIATFENDSIQSDVDSKQSAIDRQKLKVDAAQEKVNNLKIVAPFDGIFSTDFVNKKVDVLSSYHAGSKVDSGTQFGAVASLEDMQLPIQVDELDLPNIKTGMKAEIKVDSLPGRTIAGEVTQVSTVGTTTNGVTFYDVVIAAKNTNNQLKYGMTATAEVLIQDKEGVIYLPPEALQSQKGKRFVSLKKPDGTVEAQHEIEIGIRSKTQIEITKGLNEGDKVVIPQLKRQQNLSQDEVNRLRQQFQQNGGGAGGFGGGAGGFGGGAGGAGGFGGGNSNGGATRVGGGGNGGGGGGGGSNR
ncbi:efflux RND transporter periplasmic adaptor subunit [Paenibacillus athensensis]|uniref:Efflux transporter periplasmic adaptor subunit n=1 Tax=Paenibacillus athensensis TaxID=1967502 RepID=A0A4Y8Q776_9BACL|nr:efflux RND transporter periplasmic adaptor subunit [Paenibacillus athensensis]MCD1257330.1 efflux RND transporter periplasmic adaptor subunit [Paenibacillus athensensis]